MKTRIYFTLMSFLITGMAIGSLLSLDEYEPREDNEKIPLYPDKVMVIAGILLFAAFWYRAGTEYHNIKKLLFDQS